MKKAIDDGGQAFPVPADDKAGWHSPEGMSLRDWFAGQALAGICAGLCSDHTKEGRERAFDRVGFTDAAKDAYTLADAMITARKGGA